MLSTSSLRSLLGAGKRLKVSGISRAFETSAKIESVPAKSQSPEGEKSTAPSHTTPEASQQPTVDVKEWPARLDDIGEKFRLPRSVQAVYLRPLRRKAEYGLPVCDLQLRSYSVRNVEFFADFAVRAAYYLKLPVSGPVPLPRIVERWTVPRSNFVHKKSQENFERITLRRLIQIKDGHPKAVQAWLAFLRKHAFYGVGMKANVWEYDTLDVAKSMDESLPELEKSLEPYFENFGQRKDAAASASVSEILGSERFSQNRGPLTDTLNDIYCRAQGQMATLFARQGKRFPICQIKNTGSSHHIRCLQTSTLNSSPPPSQPPHEKTIFSGIQPTGVPHLGNYLGALREWVRLQNDSATGTKLIFSIVDLHALTVPQDASRLREWKREAFTMLLAIGLDPNRCTIFYQSAVSAHAELMWILSTVASMGYLSRMTQWKSKLKLPEDTSLEHSAAKSKLRLGLFSYPVLQAADILVHRATHVPVGEDQKQHIEFTRYTANSFNHLYGPIFPSPEPLISPARRVMSLKEPHQKMSKSHTDDRSRILLTDSPEQIRKKIKLALTDSEPSVTYDPVHRPGVSNLLEILCHLQSDNKSCEEVALEHRSTSIRALKELVADTLVNHLNGIRERFFALQDQRNYVDSVAEAGAIAARANADSTMKTIRAAMGL
ncbi:hypothetical protein DTO027B5_2756 [Paecilomyces variotii]|nr:hypothetical protein DTO169C6_6124 [Paecilomyces variotii]KAJ9289767.1 hypothetical protein DTO021C3_2481 [Paecilomyces variotii]KAJ9323749.1 hypothetical protein DTO027B3_5368 [Paecilomyces variotii]KAJ9335339.1 hypothetical protein DTO027B5_2756 [Paecilomyces variotii]